MTRLTVEKFPTRAPSFAGNAALVLVGFAVIVAIAAVLVPILENACSLGCPQ